MFFSFFYFFLLNHCQSFVNMWLSLKGPLFDSIKHINKKYFFIYFFLWPLIEKISAVYFTIYKNYWIKESIFFLFFSDLPHLCFLVVLWETNGSLNKIWGKIFSPTFRPIFFWVMLPETNILFILALYGFWGVFVCTYMCTHEEKKNLQAGKFC